MPVKINATGGGSVTVAAASTASDFTLTLPAVTDTVVGLAATQTLTNKTLTTPVIATINGGTSSSITLQSNGTNGLIVDTSQNLQFNSGYGSVATAYGCRAWVNFNGTTNVGGFCTIRASGGVSSIADNGAGDYTVNFTTAMPDANYAVVGMASAGADGALDTLRGISLWGPTSITTTTARIRTMNGINTAAYDAASAMISVFR